ncbi:pilus assembly protein TadG-related protein [Allonocardiopsis opalescens]|uniref:Putative Flp pilus-assembly TadE/G-like protein n=1 Tax=Allonocardiopsis opalescens TaxID=1144618 RepID=A0A2T0PVE5_9ACTN|nr:pilus assembly protein TadG-related protein [Allonocardiopsis opalescens]PRX95503.1 putative Flp pilus-assembly TadE/G-like protein [Allonocardiopsis opalescens]
MIFRFPSSSSRDQGNASILLMTGLTLALVALSVLFVRIGNANDMRSNAQTAADAAALAGAQAIRDASAEIMADSGFLHFAMVSEGMVETRASQYAERNGAVLQDVRLSSGLGTAVRVEVTGPGCQRSLEEGGEREWGDTECQGNEEEDDIPTIGSNAAAVARVIMPDCEPVWNQVLNRFVSYCNGIPIFQASTAYPFFEVELVDEEEPYAYSALANLGSHVMPGSPMGNCTAPDPYNVTGQVTAQMCATHNVIVSNFDFPHGVGCFRHGPPEHGIGQACDYMISNYTTPTQEQLAYGDQVALSIMHSAAGLGIKYIIWRQRIWNHENLEPPTQSVDQWRLMEDRGSVTQNHYDHIHVSVVR